MNPEQRQRLIELLISGSEVAPEWSRILFPPEKREYELVYYGKEREEDIIAHTLAVPLQPVRTFNKNGVEWHNKLIFGDNLQAMKSLLEMKRRGELCNADGTAGVRLVYIDPPFATKQDFQGSQGQKAYQDKIAGARFIEFLRKRLILLRELLAEDGCLYLHLDIKKIHYIKIILDEVFGEGRFINEIIWKRTSAHADSTTHANVHQSLLLYSKSKSLIFNPRFVPYAEKYIAERYKHIESNGPRNGQRFADGNLTGAGLSGGGYSYEWNGVSRIWRCPIETMRSYEKENRLYYTRNGVARIKRYVNDLPGVPVSDTWIDINPVNSQAAERVDYPTQKPEALLQRIIATSSNDGDIVLDAFSGSGTTCVVAEKLGRRWIGIDCGKLAIYTIQKRLLKLKAEIGNKGAPLKAKPFTLYNTGLYDKTPELDYAVGHVNLDGEAFICITHFHSDEAVRDPIQKRGNCETLSMVMLDYDYDADIFDLDEVFYANVIGSGGWEIRFPARQLGQLIMAVFVDIYGNEARLVIPSTEFFTPKPDKATRTLSMAQKTVMKVKYWN